MGRVIDLYALLGVKRDASPVELDKAFRKKAKELHPDKGGTAEAFNQLSQAIRVLRDPDKRAHYDRGGAFGENDTATRPDPAIDLVKIEVEGLIAAFLGSDKGASNQRAARPRAVAAKQQHLAKLDDVTGLACDALDLNNVVRRHAILFAARANDREHDSLS